METQHVTRVPTIPANAPFTTGQRAWLNGFFAGLVSTGQVGSGAIETGGGSPAMIPAGAALGAATAPAAPAAEQPKKESWKDVQSDDPAQYPWHDSALSIDDRMSAAEGKPLELKMMAAMAQLNCGQCDYLCRTYAKAIETGEETDLKKCVPGGKKTARMLVQLQKEATKTNGQAVVVNTPVDTAPAAAAATNGQPVAAPAAVPGTAEGQQIAYSRQNPFPAPAVLVEKLTGDGSAKDTRLISMSLSGSGLRYKVGDALGVFPKNGKDQVEALINLFGHDGSEPVRTPDGISTTFRGALSDCCDLKTASDAFLESMIGLADSKQTKKLLEKCLEDEEVEGLPPQPRLIDVVARFRDIKMPLTEIIKTLDPLKPRLYSIASSPLVDPNRVDLVVGVVQYQLAGQQRHGVASTFLANRMIGHEPVPVFVQPCHHFGLPENPDTPVIMVGPGTGVAPFRAFLHERRAAGAGGDNWLFFGDQHASTDYLLKDELGQMQSEGLLNRLSTAFSRDQEQRIYVQNRMLEEGQELWNWLQRGAHFYVCGDAARMAGDVDRALHQIASSVGGLSEEAAADYIKDLRKTNRYQRDVY
ncbi:sulfite reductase subunit alpha [Stieleria sp. TO1_6]|uniref:sulfite reductase subunit alpha n=1 Tax=Stieleria tagensis TaxID=2956795 RepID=UPI00209AFD0F|nr:sulfite reductase subunit alpha [Stieleria tagensis]MCO8125013.1 sulfite reductase subunit alpha [Stieleria tagensis]